MTALPPEPGKVSIGKDVKHGIPGPAEPMPENDKQRDKNGDL